VEYIQLAQEYQPLNLGQGFPDFAAPDYVTKALSEVASGENVLLNQYTRGFVSFQVVVGMQVHTLAQLFTAIWEEYLFFRVIHD